MANSSIITTIKSSLAKELIKDDEIRQAIDSSKIATPEDLMNNHIFTYNQNPFTQNMSGTFITIQVHAPSTYDRSNIFIKPVLEIWIISHYKHMKIDNIPKIQANRNDYLSQLLDVKFNGKNYGIGSMRLISNIEGAFQKDYLYRKMEFEGLDINNSFCIDEN